MELRKFILISSVIGLISIWIGAFVISYVSLTDVAANNGIVYPWAWIWPFLLDAFMSIASLDVVRREMDGSKTAWAWSLVILVTVVSTIFNLTRADGSYLSYAVHALAPLVCFASFEVVIGIIRSDIKQQDSEINSDSKLSPRERVMAYYNENPGIPYAEAAREIGLSANVVRYHALKLKGGE